MKLDQITLTGLEHTCVGIGIKVWEKLMHGAIEFNDDEKDQINKMIKRDLPDMYDDLCLEFYNPYNYSYTKNHIIVVHSSIEYFISYE